MPLIASPNAVGAKGSDALRALSAAAQKCSEALQEGQQEHDDLRAECDALKQELDDLKASTRAVSDPYVIVLVDAHTHKFGSDLMGNHLKGGAKAAQLLKTAVVQYLTPEFPDVAKYRTVARVYMSPNKMMPSFFTGGFSRENSFFDCIDGVGEDVIETKLAGILKVELHNPNCRHIFIGARYNPIYTTIFQTSDKITFIQGDTVDQAVTQVRPRPNYVKFPQVFQSVSKDAYTNNMVLNKATQSPSSAVCKYDQQKGGCTQQDCGYTHLTSPRAPSDSRLHGTKALNKLRQLPTSFRTGLIPVNAQDERLDTQLSPPTKAQWATYDARRDRKKLCAAFHLQNACNESACGYDHDPVDADTLYCLRYFWKRFPCKYGTKCRRWNCHIGHVCQSGMCDAGKVGTCMISRPLHDIDYKLAKWVSSDTDTAVSEGQDGVQNLIDL